MKGLIHLVALLPFTSALSAQLLPRQGVPVGGNSSRELNNCPQPDEAFLKLSDELAVEEGNVEDNSTTTVEKRAEVKIPTWVHVVAVNKTYKGGWVSVSFKFLKSCYGCKEEEDEKGEEKGCH